MKEAPFITNDVVVFGLLMLSLGFVFYSSSLKNKFWKRFYQILPSILLAYSLPAILNSLNIISPEWETVNDTGKIISHKSSLYGMAKNYLLPASLVLMTLSIDLKAILNLGSKALIMFLTATVGIIIGGPLAIMIIALISPEVVGGADFDAIWRGLATLAGSWIGGGANQATMLEIYQYNPEKYGGMVFVDIIVANIWMAVILIGVGKNRLIDKWLKADVSAIEDLKKKVKAFTEKTARIPTLSEMMILAGIVFAVVGGAHFGAELITDFLSKNVSALQDPISFFSFLNSHFFWMVTLSTVVGIGFSYTKMRGYEGIGAGKIGSVFIYILVATIGMKMDLTLIMENPGLILVGLVWITIHAILLVGVAKLIRAPYFFLAVGSTANVGGAATAPIVAASFHPSLTTVGVLLAVCGYAIGTFGAVLCAQLMEIISS